MQLKEDMLSNATASLTGEKNEQIKSGIRAGIPIAVGYIPIAIAFGLLAKAAGIPNYISMMMSFFIYAGASQFVGVSLISLGTGFAEIVLTTFILNLRHLLMSASLFQRVEKQTGKRLLSLMSFGITDETFSVASLEKKQILSVYFLLGLNLIAFFAWNVGTAIGIFVAEGLPDMLKSSMGIALYAMFIALLVPTLKKSLPVLVTASAAAITHTVIHWVPLANQLSTGWAIIISTMIGALAGSCLFPKGIHIDE